MRISLFFPPPAELTQPYLALPALVAFLKGHGFTDVTQHDLGLTAFDELATADNLEHAANRVRARLNDLDHSDRLTAPALLEYDALQRAAAVSEGLADGIETSKRYFRDGLLIDDMERYRQHAGRIHAAFRVLSAACYPTEWTEHHFTMARTRRLQGTALLERARYRETNPLVDFMRRHAERALVSDPHLVGISVAFGSQFIPALTLAQAFRDFGFNGHIVLGGAFISHCGSRLPGWPALFDVVDSCVLFAGEWPLVRLAEAIRDRQPLATVPSLLYREQGRVVATPLAEPARLDELPAPDFEGLPLAAYLSPQPILPLLASRGCYWDRCTFCSHTWSYNGRYEHHTAEQVVEQIKTLIARHGARHFYFVDECLAPAVVRQIANTLLAQDVDIRWMADVRYDNAFSPELLALAHRSGCRLLAFGLESINERVVSLMRKGTQRPVIERIMGDCQRLGIASNVMFFIGFPTETEAEARETLSFVLQHHEAADMVSLGTFQFNANARMHLISDAVGLRSRGELPADELTDFYHYTVASGMSELASSQLEEEFLRTLHAEGYDCPLLSRTHALLVERGSYGFYRRPGRAAIPDDGKVVPVLVRGFTPVRRRFAIADVRRGVRAIREHLRTEALLWLRAADEALADCTVSIDPRPTLVLNGTAMDDWAVDLSEADAQCLPAILGLRSLPELARHPDASMLLMRLCRLERLGVIRLVYAGSGGSEGT